LLRRRRRACSVSLASRASDSLREITGMAGNQPTACSYYRPPGGIPFVWAGLGRSPKRWCRRIGQLPPNFYRDLGPCGFSVPHCESVSGQPDPSNAPDQRRAHLFADEHPTIHPGFCILMLEGPLSIDIPSVPNLNNVNHLCLIIHSVDHPIVALSDSIKVRSACEFFDPMWARFSCQ
jgi:hypothetical protein